VNIRNLLTATLCVVVLSGINQAQTSTGRAAINRGNELVRQQKYEAAITEYRSVSADDKEANAQAIYNIGVCYYELWRTDEAINYFRQALNVKQGRYPKAALALGVALQDQAKVAEAKAAYLQSLNASHGEYALAHYALGLLLANENDFAGAAIHFKAASKHAGFHEPASHNNLGVMLARMGRLAEAEPEFATALRKANGVFEDAANNLKLCRILRENRGEIAELRITLLGNPLGQ
jgi:tetratricopeptide (TPR) repeat protein